MKSKYIILICAFGLILNSCHKYPEDPFRSLRRARVRLTPDQNETFKHFGKWKIVSYKISGVEHISDFTNLVPTGNSFERCFLLFFAGRENQDWGEIRFIDENENFLPNFGSGRYSLYNSDITNLELFPADSLGRTLFVWTVPSHARNGWTILELYGKTFRITDKLEHKIAIEFRKQ